MQQGPMPLLPSLPPLWKDCRQKGDRLNGAIPFAVRTQ